jgi:secretion/DNA translocation related CpaE-like protein
VQGLAFVGGVERVYVLPEDEAEVIGAFADAVEGTAGPTGHVVGVVGGRGGAGASILAAGLGMAVSRSGGSGLLVDCDPLGGGIDLVLGADREEGLRWPELKVSGGRVAMAALRDALPCVRQGRGGGELSFVSCDREGDSPHPAAIAAVVEAGRRAGRTVICDLPRDLADGALAAVDRADLVILLVPAEVRACVAARRLLRRLADRTTDIGVVVRGPSPDDLTPRVVAEAVGAPLLAAMDTERALARGLERGVFEPKAGGPLSTAADTVLTALRTGRSA